MRKGISLVILIITVIILLLLTTVVVNNGLDIGKDVEYIRFEKEIQTIEKAIRKAKLKEKTYGVLSSEYSTDVTNTINLINTKYSLSLTTDNCYVLNQEDLKSMGISNVRGEYIVDYENSYVFLISGFNDEGEIIYTTQEI